MPVTVDDDTIEKFLSGIYSAKWMRSWFILQQQIERENRHGSTNFTPNEAPLTTHDKLLTMLQAFNQKEFAITPWEKNFLIDNQENTVLSEGPGGQVSIVEKLWRRFKT